jgi:hypothetical protein
VRFKAVMNVYHSFIHSLHFIVLGGHTGHKTAHILVTDDPTVTRDVLRLGKSDHRKIAPWDQKRRQDVLLDPSGKANHAYDCCEELLKMGFDSDKHFIQRSLGGNLSDALLPE